MKEKYEKLRNKVNNLKKHAKEKFYNNLESSISDCYSNDKNNFGILYGISLKIIVILAQYPLEKPTKTLIVIQI